MKKLDNNLASTQTVKNYISVCLCRLYNFPAYNYKIYFYDTIEYIYIFN